MDSVVAFLQQRTSGIHQNKTQTQMELKIIMKRYFTPEKWVFKKHIKQQKLLLRMCIHGNCMPCAWV